MGSLPLPWGDYSTGWQLSWWKICVQVWRDCMWKDCIVVLSILNISCSVFSATVSWASPLNNKTGSRTSKFVCISGNEWVNLVGEENYSVVNRTVENQPTTIFCLELFSHKERQNYHKLFLKEGTVRLWTSFLL